MLAQFSKSVVNFLKDESGPTAVEYAVMLALIIVVCISAITTLGTNANNTFSYTGTPSAAAAEPRPSRVPTPGRPVPRDRPARWPFRPARAGLFFCQATFLATRLLPFFPPLWYIPPHLMDHDGGVTPRPFPPPRQEAVWIPPP